MIPLIVKQLGFVAQRRSFAFVARQIGLPYRQTLQMRTKALPLNQSQKKLLRNLYQRESYTSLREAGLPTHEARRWSWYRPEQVNVKISNLRLKIADLATGASAAKLRSLGIPTNTSNINFYYDEMFESITKGIRRSHESTENILDY